MNTELLAECFQIVDTDDDGKVSGEDVVFITRALGKIPDSKEAADILSKAGELADIKKVQTLAAGKYKAPGDSEADMLAAFKALDKENDGTLAEHELRHILKNLGDGMSAEEVDELFSEVRIDQNGHLNYDEFVDMLVSGYPVDA